jgi:hypothetical protein
MVANTSAPLSSVTRNDVLGSTSVTVPSSSIKSSLAMCSLQKCDVFREFTEFRPSHLL